MTTNHFRILYTIAFFLLIFVSGFGLSRSGRPYGVLLLTVHKLLSVGAVVFLTVVIVRVNRSVGLSSAELIAAVITGLLFIGTIATGGLLSTAKPMPELVHRLHQVTPFLTLVSMAATLYLLFKRK
jgi:hypothetical protein